MKQPRHLLVEAIAKRTMQVKGTSLLTHEIAAYLLTENRVSELDSILRDVIEYRAERGHVEATAVSAHPLTELAKREIEDMVKDNYPHASSITISEQIDPEVVGGVRVVLPHEQLDMTLRSKLANFKRLTSIGKE